MILRNSGCPVSFTASWFPQHIFWSISEKTGSQPPIKSLDLNVATRNGRAIKNTPSSWYVIALEVRQDSREPSKKLKVSHTFVMFMNLPSRKHWITTVCGRAARRSCWSLRRTLHSIFNLQRLHGPARRLVGIFLLWKHETKIELLAKCYVWTMEKAKSQQKKTLSSLWNTMTVSWMGPVLSGPGWPSITDEWWILNGWCSNTKTLRKQVVLLKNKNKVHVLRWACQRLDLNPMEVLCKCEETHQHPRAEAVLDGWNWLNFFQADAYECSTVATNI